MEHKGIEETVIFLDMIFILLARIIFHGLIINPVELTMRWLKVNISVAPIIFKQ